MNKELKIAVAGIGTVGTGVLENIKEKNEIFFQKTGINIRVTAISSRTKTGRDIDISSYEWHDNPLDLLKTDADVIVETIGGASGIALELITGALRTGKHVVTANKSLLAVHGNDLAQLAEDNNLSLGYEAAVAGGIPIVKTLREGLTANHHSRVYGILNGTCNYILTQMEETGGNFAEILKAAQELGYAEADPTLDVGGFDTAHKLTILSALAFGIAVDYKATFVEGIEHITSLDIEAARKLGYRIKLLGIATYHDGKILQRVHPAMLPPETHAASVGGVYNAVVVQSDYAQDSISVGCGAGRKPTASAIVADIMDIARDVRLPFLGVPIKNARKIPFSSMSERTGRYYLRLNLKDRAGAIADITGILAKNNISVQSFLQEEQTGEDVLSVIIVTHKTIEYTMTLALKAIEKSDNNVGKPVMIRIFHP